MADGRQLKAESALDSVPWVLTCSVALALLGILNLWSVTTVYGPNPYEHVVKQSIFLALAVAAGGATAALGFRRLAAFSRPMLIVTWMLLIMVLFMPPSLGARRWIVLGALNIQPSELAKPVMIIMLSAFCAARRGLSRHLTSIFLPGSIYIAITAVLILLEPDLGQTVFILGLCLLIMLINGLRLVHVSMVGLVVLPLVILIMKERFSYIQERIDTFTSGGMHYQVSQGLLALASGGLLGAGIGGGRAQLKFVPKIHNDFVMVAIGEQFGFIGCLLVMILFILLVYHGLRIAFKARDDLGFSIAFGITIMIGLQAAVNLAVITNSVPPKGISLPFVSYGGSSLVVLGASLGVLLSIARDTAREHEQESAAITFRTHPRPGPFSPFTPETSRKNNDQGMRHESVARRSNSSPILATDAPAPNQPKPKRRGR